jgi:ATP-dependent Zn protease
MNDQDRRSTAIHEAGPAVAAWVFDVEMHAVSIRQTEEHTAE